MGYETIDIVSHNNYVAVKLNRPEVHNAMNEALIKELTECFQHCSKDTAIRSVVLTGNGKSFCAGADLNWMKSMVSYSKEENIRDSRLLLDLFEAIYYCPKPVIGRINGHAFGGGLGLIAVCDVAIGIPGQKYGFSEVNLGIIPSVISSFVAPRMKFADMRRFFLTGERFDSVIAHEIGILDYVVSGEKLDEQVQFYVDLLNSSGPKAVVEVKNLIEKLQHMERSKYKEFTVKKIAELRISQEGQEGINAFLEKRYPQWRKK
jgi:methylglutaconyl-CoA hydratase